MPFTARFTVRSYELDMLGHVNNAVYLNYLEQARLQAFEFLGWPLQGLLDGSWMTTVARIEIDYRREARFGDRLVVVTEVDRVGRTSITLAHRIERESDPTSPVADARVVIVWLGPEGRPSPVPDEVRRALEGAEAPGGTRGG